MTYARLLEELTQARQELYALLREIAQDPEALWQADAVQGMSVAELCGHISAWEDRLLTALQQVAQGNVDAIRNPDVLGLDGAFCRDELGENRRFNASQRHRRLGWSWEALLRELVLIREETGWNLAHMPESVLYTVREVETEDQGPIRLCPADLVTQIAAHDRLHTAQLRAWWQRYREQW